MRQYGRTAGDPERAVHMINEVQQLLDEYLSWLGDKTSLRQIENYVEITTPYLDRHNDYLQIYTKPRDGNFLLTDDGYVIDGLEQSGCKLDNSKRKKLLQIILNGFGVTLNGTALEVQATSDNFALRKHNLLQAMLAVNDLFYLATPMEDFDLMADYRDQCAKTQLKAIIKLDIELPRNTDLETIKTKIHEMVTHGISHAADQIIAGIDHINIINENDWGSPTNR